MGCGMGIPQYLSCFLRILYADKAAAVRTGHGTIDWFQIGKWVHQGCILSPYLFNLYAEYIIQNAGLDEAQAGIKIVGRNISNFRYADDALSLSPLPTLGHSLFLPLCFSVSHVSLPPSQPWSLCVSLSLWVSLSLCLPDFLHLLFCRKCSLSSQPQRMC